MKCPVCGEATSTSASERAEVLARQNTQPCRTPPPVHAYLQRQEQVHRVRLLGVARRQERDECRPVGLRPFAENLGEPNVASVAAVLAAQSLTHSQATTTSRFEGSVQQARARELYGRDRCASGPADFYPNGAALKSATWGDCPGAYVARKVGALFKMSL